MIWFCVRFKKAGAVPELHEGPRDQAIAGTTVAGREQAGFFFCVCVCCGGGDGGGFVVCVWVASPLLQYSFVALLLPPSKRWRGKV